LETFYGALSRRNILSAAVMGFTICAIIICSAHAVLLSKMIEEEENENMRNKNYDFIFKYLLIAINIALFAFYVEKVKLNMWMQNSFLVKNGDCPPLINHVQDIIDHELSPSDINKLVACIFTLLEIPVQLFVVQVLTFFNVY